MLRALGAGFLLLLSAACVASSDRVAAPLKITPPKVDIAYPRLVVVRHQGRWWQCTWYPVEGRYEYCVPLGRKLSEENKA